MDTDCIFGLGLAVGAVGGALVAHGLSLWRLGRGKMQGLAAAKTKAEGEVTKAKERYRQGKSELPGAFFLVVLGLSLLIFLLIIIVSGTF